VRVERPDLEAYAARIGYHGRFTPTLQTLTALHRLHPASLPFENLAALSGAAPELSVSAIEAKLVRQRRGGWCFEHNLLLWAVLREAGFTVTGLAARVLWRQSAQPLPPRSHMLLRVELPDGPRLVDVGFGGLTLTAPLRLEPDDIQETPHERFVLRRHGAAWRLDVCLPRGDTPLYAFDLSPQEPVDYAHANWYLATHPQSHFVSTLMVARAVADGRHALRNAEYVWRPIHGEAAVRQVEDAVALGGLLADVFGIEPPAAAGAALARMLHNAGT
jgi:N-hydroxyarylamine O-acetyltransferase